MPMHHHHHQDVKARAWMMVQDADDLSSAMAAPPLDQLQPGRRQPRAASAAATAKGPAATPPEGWPAWLPPEGDLDVLWSPKEAPTAESESKRHSSTPYGGGPGETLYRIRNVQDDLASAGWVLLCRKR